MSLGFRKNRPSRKACPAYAESSAARWKANTNEERT
jgi:hypothetical protein